ncbi:MAG TPA: TyeA family type III secretion system gatekeeper subunit [Schlesneria sp.]|jgi:type III secretion system YopN/LcrE/InvE/MxiC family regulator
MITRIDPSDANANSAPPRISASASAPADAVEEIIPARSVYELSHSGFAKIPTNFNGAPLTVGNLSGESVAETLENISFSLGTRLHERRRGSGSGEGYADRTIARTLLQQLIKENSPVSAPDLDCLRDRFQYDGHLEATLDAIRQAGLSSGEKALILSIMLDDGKLVGADRKLAEGELDSILRQNDWALELFACLEFGQSGLSGLSELRQLYQRAISTRKRLSEWFQEFRRLRDRSRKLKTIIHALAFELSAQGPAMDVHLAAVITDLRRILQFLGLEDHCDRLARRLDMHDTNGDSLMQTLLECVEQGWVGADWVATRAQAAASAECDRYRYARGLIDLIKMMPDDCFDDTGQRETILTAFAEYAERVADAEH